MTFEEMIILMIFGFAGIIGTGFSLKIMGKFGTKVKKKSKKEELTNVIELQNKAIGENYLIEIAQLKKDKQSLYGKINRLQDKNNKLAEQLENQIEEEEEEEEIDSSDIQSKYEIVPEKAIKYVADFGLNPEALSNPALAPIVWQKIEENLDIALAIGVIRPKGTISQMETPTAPTQDSGQAFIDSIVSKGNTA
jgi:hypothetical protein